jgi:hypothetical protein
MIFNYRFVLELLDGGTTSIRMDMETKKLKKTKKPGKLKQHTNHIKFEICRVHYIDVKTSDYKPDLNGFLKSLCGNKSLITEDKELFQAKTNNTIDINRYRRDPRSLLKHIEYISGYKIHIDGKSYSKLDFMNLRYIDNLIYILFPAQRKAYVILKMKPPECMEIFTGNRNDLNINNITHLQIDLADLADSIYIILDKFPIITDIHDCNKLFTNLLNINDITNIPTAIYNIIIIIYKFYETDNYFKQKLADNFTMGIKRLSNLTPSNPQLSQNIVRNHVVGELCEIGVHGINEIKSQSHDCGTMKFLYIKEISKCWGNDKIQICTKMLNGFDDKMLTATNRNIIMFDYDNEYRELDGIHAANKSENIYNNFRFERCILELEFRDNFNDNWFYFSNLYNDVDIVGKRSKYSKLYSDTKSKDVLFRRLTYKMISDDSYHYKSIECKCLGFENIEYVIEGFIKFLCKNYYAGTNLSMCFYDDSNNTIDVVSRGFNILKAFLDGLANFVILIKSNSESAIYESGMDAFVTCVETILFNKQYKGCDATNGYVLIQFPTFWEYITHDELYNKFIWNDKVNKRLRRFWKLFYYNAELYARNSTMLDMRVYNNETVNLNQLSSITAIKESNSRPHEYTESDYPIT